MTKSNTGTGLIVLAIAILVAPFLFLIRQDEGPERDDDRTEREADRNVTAIEIGHRAQLYSEVLEEDREYLVYLPSSYNDDTFTERSYPVLYLLDGDAHFHSVSGVVQFLSEDANGTRRIPEMIVVAIPNTDRTRDLTPTHTMIGYDGTEAEFLTNSGGGDLFLDFLEGELFVEIENTYRTLPHRTLVGHSFGGLLTLHALVNSPELFDHYVAIDPSLWWHDQLLVTQAREVFQAGHGRTGSVYISLANNPDLGFGNPELMQNAGRAFADVLQTANTDAFSSEMGYYEGDDHGSVPLISLYDGLQSNFVNYEIDIRRVVADPAYVLQHYAQVGADMGVDFPPPEADINNIGYFFIYAAQDYEKAAITFALNVDLYPDSYDAYDSLGEAHKLRGDTSLAIANYEKSLELNPDNENAREQIAEMTREMTEGAGQ